MLRRGAARLGLDELRPIARVGGQPLREPPYRLLVLAVDEAVDRSFEIPPWRLRQVVALLEVEERPPSPGRWCIDRNAATAPPLSRLLLDGDREGLWLAEGNHPIQDVAGDDHLGFL